MKLDAVLLDFGGVIAEEGFRGGLYVIARQSGLDAESFLNAATGAVYDSGYVSGTGNEADFWNLLRMKTGLVGNDLDLRDEILSRFVPRARMLDLVRSLRNKGLRVAILSDQSDWLDLLDERYDFFKEFDSVFNSYHLGKTKRDATIFTETLSALGVLPEKTLFVDDNAGHIARAGMCGMQTHLFKELHVFETFLKTAGLA